MKTGIFQFDVRFGDKLYNLNKVANRLSQSDFDLMVLPELFTTGYLFSSREELAYFAEPVPGGETTQMLLELARQKQAFLTGSLVECDHDCLYNTAVVVGPQGFIGKHRKIHLPRFENRLFDRGSDLEVFDLDGVRIGVVLCFESWFPEICRLMMQKGAQILCNPANFGGPWSLDIIKVRAIENILFTITANRTGAEQRDGMEAEFRGESQVVQYDGEVLCRLDDREDLAVVEIDPQRASQKANLLCDDLTREMDFYTLSPAVYPMPKSEHFQRRNPPASYPP